MHALMRGNGQEPDEPGDPPYISNLLSAETDNTCYFLVGNPITETTERIGAVPAMLMAHSLVLRRVLSQQETELCERWDITLPFISPRTFKRVLKFAYGYNNIKEYTVKETLDILKAGDMLVMHPMIVEASKHIVNIMSPSNICEILQEQVCLDYAKLEHEISNLVRTKSKEVFAAENLQLICAAGMRFILLLDNLQVSQIELWRTMIKWARRKVLRDITPLNSRLDGLIEPALIVPCMNNLRLCLFNLIAIVEEAQSQVITERDFLSMLSTYHYVNTTLPINTVSICNVDNSEKTIVHNSYEVKVIYNCAFWTDPELLSTSILMIQTPENRGATLHAIVCTALSKKPGAIDDLFKHVEISGEEISPVYECKCCVRIIFVTDTDRIEISRVYFCQNVLFDEEFQIFLNPDMKELKLEPNGDYTIEMNFVIPHPLWYSNDAFRLGANEDLIVGCGYTDEAKRWFGSHIKYLLYKRDEVTH